MRTARLLVLALLAGAAVAGAALPDPTTAGGGTVTDPQGDAVGAGPDIAAFSVCHTATELQLDVNLFTPWGNDKGVVIDLDVDQNSNTGAMSAVWWKSERKASSSGAVGLQLRPLGSGCRRMTPWEAIAGSGTREKGARSPRTQSSA